MSELVVWDAEAFPDETDTNSLLLWRSYGNAFLPDAVSVPKLVEDNADHLRKKYLSWVFELGQTLVGGRSVADWMAVRPGFSAWWMTSIAEKCNYDKSPWIDDAIKLMALDEWGASRSFRRLRLFSDNSALAECLRLWCGRFGVSFEWTVVGCEARVGWVRRFYRRIPAPVRAVVWLVRHLIDRWPLRGVGVDAWKASSGRTSFVSYLLYLDARALAESSYKSSYWAHLPELLKARGCPTNWLHIYVKSPLVPSARVAANAIANYNRAESGAQVHVALDSFLSVEAVVEAVCRWFRLARLSRRLEEGLEHTTSGLLALWPMFRIEWREAMLGPVAINNQLYLSLFARAFAALPRQAQGVYLQENMDWEYPCLWSWKASGHGQIIGSPHSTVRYWDLRYFFDSRGYDKSAECAMPMPDMVALNGPAAVEAYRNGNYPMDKTVEVEALRYLQFGAVRQIESSNLRVDESKIRLLVLGDYSKRYTASQMDLLVRAMQAPGLRERIEVTVKPHLSNPILLSDYPDLDYEVSMNSIVDLLAKCDLAYTSAATSAAVDAYCAGVPVAVFLDPGVLNQSPLRGWDGAHFVASPEGLVAAIDAAQKSQRIQGRADRYFNLAHNLPLWDNLLTGASLDLMGENSPRSG